MKSNVIGLDSVLVMRGREDENGQAHKTEEQLEGRYIRKEKHRLTNRIRQLVEKMDYIETEIHVNLMVLLNEWQEEMRKNMGYRVERRRSEKVFSFCISSLL